MYNPYAKLGEKFKYMGLASVLTLAVSFVIIWYFILGFQVVKLLGEMEDVPEFKEIAPVFKKSLVIQVVLFIIGMVLYVAFMGFYFFVMLFFQLPGPGGMTGDTYGMVMQSMTIILIVATVVGIALLIPEIVVIKLNIKVWEGMRDFFEKRASGEVAQKGSKGAAHLIKAQKYRLIGVVISIIVLIAPLGLIPFFLWIPATIPMLAGVKMTGFFGMLTGVLIISIIISVVSIAAAVVGIMAFVYEIMGYFALERPFVLMGGYGGSGFDQGGPRGDDEHAQPGTPYQQVKWCIHCNAQLPPDESLRYCPMCGALI